MGKVAVAVLMQKVFHDGSSMVVLRPGIDGQEVDEKFISGLVKEGVIAEPDSNVLSGSRAGGFTDAGEHTSTGGGSSQQEFDGSEAKSERSALLADNEALRSANEALRSQIAELEAILQSADPAAGEERHLPQLDHDGDGNPGGSEPYDPPSLTGKNKAELLAIAEAEGVAIEEGATNAAIVEAIEAARAGEDEAPAA